MTRCKHEVGSDQKAGSPITVGFDEAGLTLEPGDIHIPLAGIAKAISGAEDRHSYFTEACAGQRAC